MEAIKTDWVSLFLLKVNTGQIEGVPPNPRFIKNKDFKNLINSILIFPKMLFLRPITYAQDYVVLGGNQRKEALIEISKMTFSEIEEFLNGSIEFQDKPVEDKEWILDFWQKFHNSDVKPVPAQNATGFSIAEMTEFVVKDNVGYGQDDFNIYKEHWDIDKIVRWGVDIPKSWRNDEKKEVVEDGFEVKDTVNTEISEGDLIEIGVHRLLCGDARNESDYKKLLDGKRPDIAVADPPYGIGVVENNTRMQELGHTQYANDDDTTTAITSYNICSNYCDKLVFWGANHYANKLPNVAGWLVWDKQNGKDSLTYSMGELAWTNIIGNVQIFTHVWDGFRKDSERNEKRLHPSQKPVKLIAWVLDKTYCKILLDPFNGCGTGMLAAHQKEMVCYAMEIEPIYCEITILRMLNYDSGLKVVINGKDVTEKYIKRLDIFRAKR